MALNRPTLSELVERVTTDLSTRLIGSATPLRRSVIRILANVIAGASHLAYGFLEYLAKQIFADKAEDEYLRRLASIYGVEAIAATFAEGDVTFTGTHGTVIDAGSIVQNTDGLEYTTDVEATIAGGTVTVAVTCTTAGVDGNMDAGNTVSLLSPISGVTNDATVAAGGLTGGADQEDTESLRERLLAEIREPGHGGSESDYEKWAMEISGVTRVWVYPSQFGTGTVGVAFVRDDDVSIIPSAGEVEDVQEYIDTLRPVTADVTVYAPGENTLDFDIELDPDSTSIRDAVEAELVDLLRREAEPGGTILISHIREAISSAAGEIDHVLNSPTTNQTASSGEIFTLGTITWS